MENLLPEFINKLLSGDIPFDFHVVVGDPETSERERIGVDKSILAARSDVFKTMLIDSEIRHETELNMPDVEPHIFKHFFAFCYNCDILWLLSVDDCLKLLVLADKYEVMELITRLESLLIPQVKLENLFMFLHYGYICETVPELWEGISKIIQYDTEEVFAHPDFVKAKEVEVSYIIQQDQLSVGEIEVWNAALKWAQHQAITAESVSPTVVSPLEVSSYSISTGSCDDMKTDDSLTSLKSVNSAENLHQIIKPLLEHIQFCKLSIDELCGMVAQTGVLTDEEIGQICCFILGIKPCIEVNHLSNKVDRVLLRKPGDFKTLGWSKCLSTCCISHTLYHSECYVTTYKSHIRLDSFTFFDSIDKIESITIVNVSRNSSMYQFTNLRNTINPSSLVVDQNVVFQPNQTYLIHIYLKNVFNCYCVNDIKNEDLEIKVISRSECKRGPTSYLKYLHYKVIA